MQSAKRLSEKENSMLCVKPWRRQRISVPGWLVFVPAAAIIGFVFGIFVGEKQSPAAMPVMAKADTVYIKQLERVTEYDTIYRTLPSETKVTGALVLVCSVVHTTIDIVTLLMYGIQNAA